jgi:hypothetical protein
VDEYVDLGAAEAGLEALLRASRELLSGTPGPSETGSP